MQRWFFGADKSNGTTIESSNLSHLNHGTASIDRSGGRKHTFRVLVNYTLEPNEHVAVTGEGSRLGNWSPAHCVQLNRENGKLTISNPPENIKSYEL